MTARNTGRGAEGEDGRECDARRDRYGRLAAEGEAGAPAEDPDGRAEGREEKEDVEAGTAPAPGRSRLETLRDRSPAEPGRAQREAREWGRIRRGEGPAGPDLRRTALPFAP